MVIINYSIYFTSLFPSGFAFALHLGWNKDMAFTDSKSSKKWTSRLSLKRFRSQPDIASSKQRSGNPPSFLSFDQKCIKLRVEFPDKSEALSTQSSRISVVKPNVVPVRIVPSPFPAVFILIPSEYNSRNSPTTFIPLIDTSDRKGLPARHPQGPGYKDACIAAEDAADEEARRRFKHYQDMYYVERALQEKSADAHAKLERLMKRARQAGFEVKGTPPALVAEDDSDRSSHDSIREFITRLDKVEWNL